MSKKSFIDSIEVKSPCTQDWEKMHGNDRIRFCDHCAKDVKDLSAVTRKEAIRLVRGSGGNLCIRYIKDPVTNRPLFAEQLLQITRRAPGVAAGVMSASIALSTAAYAQDNPRSTPPDPVQITTVNQTPRTVEMPENPIEPVPNHVVQTPERYQMMGDIAFTPALKFENPLMLAVQNDNIEEVRNLIAHGANVNGKESTKITPLFIAVENGNVEIARMLLDFGAKVNARNRDRQTPLMQIDGDATRELVRLLLDNGAKIDLGDNEGNTALMLAAEHAKPEVLQVLIDSDADVNLSNKLGWTALMYAANIDSLESVRLLLVAGAQVNVKNKDGETASDLTSDDEIQSLLVSYGAEVKEQPDAGPAEGQIDN